jgi:ribosomal 50S subunit-recycling heat shock protein
MRPGTTIRIGDVLTLADTNGVRVFQVVALPAARLGAPDAATLFRDLQTSPP